MNELHKAYQALGLEPGALFETIKRRYRRLALVWHPDRMTNADAKREAEEELKKINNMFEKLKKHFETEHTSGPGCRCKPAAAGPPPNNPHNASGGQKANTKPGATEADKKRQEEEAARKRTAERERQTAEAEAARRAAEAAQRAKEKHKAAEDAIKSESSRKEEMLRWKCAAAIGLTFIGLIAYCWVGCAARDVVHWTGKQWDEFQSQFKPKEPNPVSPSYQPPEQSTQPYIPPYERFPGGNPTSWQQFHNELEQRRNEEQRQKDNWSPFGAPAPTPNS
ncbi:MAG: J domain-containing protein [Candidatus Obscuribacter sp.]|nr:J domain-containing protein [Candidatus Obscuribacter sp.]